MRREWQVESDIKQAYHITLDVAVHDEQLTEKMLEKCIVQAIEAAGTDMSKNIEMEKINSYDD